MLSFLVIISYWIYVFDSRFYDVIKCLVKIIIQDYYHNDLIELSLYLSGNFFLIEIKLTKTDKPLPRCKISDKISKTNGMLKESFVFITNVEFSSNKHAFKLNNQLKRDFFP